MADAAARSRKLAARPHWEASRSEEEARRYLQERLLMFTRLMFVSFVILLVFLMAMYQVYPRVALIVTNNDIIFGGATVLLVIMASVWRGLLARRELSMTALTAIDTIYAVCIGLAFAFAAVLSYPLRPAAYASLVYGVCTVFTRAVIVPSTARRTLVLSTVLFAPMFIAAIYLAAATDQELPGPAYAGAAILLGSVAIVLATTGSQVIYGLRRKISEAMQFGQYTLGRRIGGGGMGEVYRAQHALLRRETAVKLMRPDRIGVDHVDRFELEVQRMSKLTHANTVAVFDYGRSPDGFLYYAMEFLDGVSLEELVRARGAQPIDRVVKILIQVCGALQEAHDAGLIHRDVTPANIILCKRGGVPDVAKVVDFGIAKEITRDTSEPTQVIVGTAYYIAPETVTDPEAIGFGVDLYALGAVAYYLLSGTRVFEGKTALDICRKHAAETPRPLSTPGVAPKPIPAELEAIVMRLLEKTPAARFPSAAALADALEAIPKQDDWDRKTADAWWREQAARQAATPSTDDPTKTMQIDLGKRG